MSVYKLAYLVAATALFVAPLSVSAQSADDSKPQFSVGVKLWNSSWLSYLPTSTVAVTPQGAPAIVESLNSVEGNKKWDVLPSLSVRYKEYFVSASYGRFTSDFTSGFTTVGTPTGANVLTSRTDHVKRDEYDINFGYAFAPGMAATIGYKGADETRDIALGIAPGVSSRLGDSNAKALLLGLAASHSFNDRWNAYGQFAFGRGKIKTTYAASSQGPASRDDANADYIIGELGLAYVLPPTTMFSRSTLGLGYRIQTVRTHSTFPVTREQRDVRDTRDGFVLSLNVSF
ncbi:MAG: hypothetical protein V4488_11575 [Pseudomonadota bacterium]